MFALIEVLSADRKLLSVDLSWNTIFDAEPSLLQIEQDNATNIHKPRKQMTKFEKDKAKTAKREMKAAERTLGQFSDLAQKMMLREKWEEEQRKEIELLGEGTYSLITGTNVQTKKTSSKNAEMGTEAATSKGKKPAGDGEAPADGDEAENAGPEEAAGEEGAEGGAEGAEQAGEQPDDQEQAEEQRPEAEDAAAADPGDYDYGPPPPEEEKSKFAPPTPKRALSDVEKAAKKRQQYLQKMAKALRKNLVGFIKYNQVLQHFNLSNTGLPEEAIRSVGISLNKSRGLVAVHLGGNPGITDKNKEFLKKRITCRTVAPAVKIEFDAEKLEKKGNSTKLSPREIFDKNSSLNSLQKKELVQDNLKLQLIKKNQQINDPSEKHEHGDNHRLDFVRVVGHQCDMPGS